MTPVSNERVSELLKRFRAASAGDRAYEKPCTWDEAEALAELALSALRSQSPEPSSSEPVAIKPLEWGADGVIAHTPFCTYSVGDYGDDAEQWQWVRSEYPYGERSDEHYPTAEAAIAAAQADYEQRILSALYAAPQPAPVVTDELEQRVMAWVRDDVLPAYGITHNTRASDPEMIEGLRAALQKQESGE